MSTAAFASASRAGCLDLARYSSPSIYLSHLWLGRQQRSATSEAAQPTAPAHDEADSAQRGTAKHAAEDTAQPDTETKPKPVTSIKLRPTYKALYLATMLKNKKLEPKYDRTRKIPKNWVRLTFAEKDRLIRRVPARSLLRKAARFREAITIARRAVRKVTARFVPDYFEETGHPESLLATIFTRENIDSYSRRVLGIKQPNFGFAAGLIDGENHKASESDGPSEVADSEQSANVPCRPPPFLRPMVASEYSTMNNADFVNPALKADRLPIRADITAQEADVVLCRMPFKELEDAKKNGTLDVPEDEFLRRKLRKAEMVARIISLYLSSENEIKRANRKKVIHMFGKDKWDTSSPEVRIAMLTLSIKRLRNYMADEKNRKDMVTKCRLYEEVARREKFLRLYKAQSQIKYYDLLHRLGLKEVRYLGFCSTPIFNRSSM